MCIIVEVCVFLFLGPGPPPAPSGVTVVGTYYNITEVTVNITWDETNESQNYTITLMSECEGRVTQEFYVVDIAQFAAQLLYDTNYTICIIAQNCAGNSTADIQQFVKCKYINVYMQHCNLTISVV